MINSFFLFIFEEKEGGIKNDFCRSLECTVSSINFNWASFTKWCITSSFSFNYGFSINLHMAKHDKLLNISQDKAVLISTWEVIDSLSWLIFYGLCSINSREKIVGFTARELIHSSYFNYKSFDTTTISLIMTFFVRNFFLSLSTMSTFFFTF